MYRTNLLTITTKGKRHFIQINGKYGLRRATTWTLRLVVNGDGARLQHQAVCVLHISTGQGVGSIVERK